MEATRWYNTQTDFMTAWNNCNRGDWMLLITSKLKIDKKLISLTKGMCAKTVIKLMKDQRSINAVNGSIDYGEGKITKKKLTELKNTANAAAYAADAVANAKEKNQKQTADVCRKYLTKAIKEKIKEV